MLKDFVQRTNKIKLKIKFYLFPEICALLLKKKFPFFTFRWLFIILHLKVGTYHSGCLISMRVEWVDVCEDTVSSVIVVCLKMMGRWEGPLRALAATAAGLAFPWQQRSTRTRPILGFLPSVSLATNTETHTTHCGWQGRKRLIDFFFF